jgi:hypothetical protein
MRIQRARWAKSLGRDARVFVCAIAFAAPASARDSAPVRPRRGVAGHARGRAAESEASVDPRTVEIRAAATQSEGERAN